MFWYTSAMNLAITVVGGVLVSLAMTLWLERTGRVSGAGSARSVRIKSTRINLSVTSNRTTNNYFSREPSKSSTSGEDTFTFFLCGLIGLATLAVPFFDTFARIALLASVFMFSVLLATVGWLMLLGVRFSASAITLLGASLVAIVICFYVAQEPWATEINRIESIEDLFQAVYALMGWGIVVLLLVLAGWLLLVVIANAAAALKFRGVRLWRFIVARFLGLTTSLVCVVVLGVVAWLILSGTVYEFIAESSAVEVPK